MRSSRSNCASTSSLNARQRKQVYMHSSIFEKGGPSTNSKYATAHQEKIYRHLKRADHAFAPELHIPNPADLKQTQNSGHNVVFPSRKADGETKEMYDPHHHHQSGNDDSMQVVRSNHAQNEAIPKEQWACPDVFNKTQDGDTRTGWKDIRNEIIREHISARDDASARDLKHYELSSSLFDHERMHANPKENGAELQSCVAHFLSEDSALCKKKANPPLSAEKRFHHNLMVSANNCALPTNSHGESTGGPTLRHGLDQPPENPRRRHEKNFSDIFGVAPAAPKKIVNRDQATSSGNGSWLDAKMEISCRSKNQHNASTPQDRKAGELKSSVFPAYLDARDVHKVDAAADSRAEMVRREKEARSSTERASAYGRKQLNLSSAAMQEAVAGKVLRHTDMWAVMAPHSWCKQDLTDRSPSMTVAKEVSSRSAPYAWSAHVPVSKELKRVSLEGSGNILG